MACNIKFMKFQQIKKLTCDQPEGHVLIMTVQVQLFKYLIR